MIFPTWKRRHHLSLVFLVIFDLQWLQPGGMLREWRNSCFKGRERGTNVESRLFFCCCVPLFSFLLNVWSSFSSSWPKSRELAGAFTAFETVSGKFDNLYSRIRINNQKHLWNPHSRKLRFGIYNNSWLWVCRCFFFLFQLKAYFKVENCVFFEEKLISPLLIVILQVLRIWQSLLSSIGHTGHLEAESNIGDWRRHEIFFFNAGV